MSGIATFMDGNFVVIITAICSGVFFVVSFVRTLHNNPVVAGLLTAVHILNIFCKTVNDLFSFCFI